MILDALYFMHKKNIVHCDLKPENILVFPSVNGRQLKIADFGLAADLDKKRVEKKTEKFRGTYYYMSPESVPFKRDGAIKKGVVGTALDIWSLGCVVIEMLTGRMAWGGYCELEDMVRYLVEEERCPDIPSHVSNVAKDFLSRCLERNPWKRWSAVSLLRHPFITQSRC
ncbi:Protein kinase superfamily protein [Euphorbia peplus]|nr:Protein kinase superfamily protein [Euphorbia peplus]